jgi:hypothetical protein
MPKLSISVPHALGQQQAVDRLKQRFHLLRETYQQHITALEEEWKEHVLSFALTTFGVTVKGSVAAEPEEVKVDAHLPLMAAMFKGRIEEQLRNELSKMLA